MVWCLILCFSDAMAAEYYCPRANAYLVQQKPELDNGLIAAEGWLYEPYPKHDFEIGREPNKGKLFFITKDCSVKNVSCIEFVQHQTSRAEKKFMLGLPARLEPGREYRYKNFRIVTDEAAISNMEVPVIQAVVWQTVNGREFPIKLTVERGRGVTYIDGLDFQSAGFTNPEICFLRTEKGLFSNTEVSPNVSTKGDVE